jgi:F-type H+-transporting ATPase subunit b
MLLTLLEASKPSLIKPNPGLMFWTLITFVIVLFVLKRYAFGPIQQMIDARRTAITADLDAAEKARGEAQAALAEYREQLAEARKEAARIVEDARRVGEERRAADVAAIEAETVRLKEQAKAEIAAETRQALSDLKQHVADLTLVATEKVVRTRLDADEQKRLIDDALADVDFASLVPESED